MTDPNDPVATALNRLPKHVVSKTLQKVDWQHSSLIRGDVARQVADLKDRYGREIQVHGSGDLAQTLIANDLVDDYHLWFYPVVLGSGKRLFVSGTVPAALTLTDTRRTSTGVVVNSYPRSGKPTYGSFALD